MSAFSFGFFLFFFPFQRLQRNFNRRSQTADGGAVGARRWRLTDGMAVPVCCPTPYLPWFTSRLHSLIAADCPWEELNSWAVNSRRHSGLSLAADKCSDVMSCPRCLWRSRTGQKSIQVPGPGNKLATNQANPGENFSPFHMCAPVSEVGVSRPHDKLWQRAFLAWFMAARSASGSWLPAFNYDPLLRLTGSGFESIPLPLPPILFLMILKWFLTCCLTVA